jgi:hypothetical protein
MTQPSNIAKERNASIYRCSNAFLSKVAGYLEHHRFVAISAFGVLYLASTCYRASRKLFWFDEFGTIFVSRLPDPESIWTALKGGADFNPPVFYLLTKLGEALIPVESVGIRLPAIVGFGLGCLCIYRFVAQRTSAVGGLVAMMFPIVTMAYWHAYDARPHGIVFGFCALSLLCWQQATSRNGSRTIWIVGLSAALAGAVMNHAFAVLLFVPICIAESFRAWTSRKIDLPIWGALFVAAFSVLILVPLARAANAGPSASAFLVPWLRLANTFQAHYQPATIVLLALVFLFSIDRLVTRSIDEKSNAIEIVKVPSHEYVALAVLLALPILATLLSLLTGAQAFDRYSISSIVGAAILIGLSTGKRASLSVATLIILLAQTGFDHFKYVKGDTLFEPSSATLLSTHMPAFAKRYLLLAESRHIGLPIALLDNLDFAATIYYAPPDLAERMVYAVFPEDNIGPYYLGLKKCCKVPISIEPIESLLNSNSAFLAYSKSSARNAERIGFLNSLGATVVVREISQDHLLFTVFPKSK